MAKIYKFTNKNKSENFIDKVNPQSISEYLAEQHPDLPKRIISAMSLAMIYSTYLSMVCEEENYSCQSLFEEPIDFLTSYGKETLH
jgi:hypothetical protein